MKVVKVVIQNDILTFTIEDGGNTYTSSAKVHEYYHMATEKLRYDIRSPDDFHIAFKAGMNTTDIFIAKDILNDYLRYEIE